MVTGWLSGIWLWPSNVTVPPGLITSGPAKALPKLLPALPDTLASTSVPPFTFIVPLKVLGNPPASVRKPAPLLKMVPGPLKLPLIWVLKPPVIDTLLLPVSTPPPKSRGPDNALIDEEKPRLMLLLMVCVSLSELLMLLILPRKLPLMTKGPAPLLKLIVKIFQGMSTKGLSRVVPPKLTCPRP